MCDLNFVSICSVGGGGTLVDRTWAVVIHLASWKRKKEKKGGARVPEKYHQLVFFFVVVSCPRRGKWVDGNQLSRKARRVVVGVFVRLAVSVSFFAETKSLTVQPRSQEAKRFVARRKDIVGRGKSQDQCCQANPFV